MIGVELDARKVGRFGEQPLSTAAWMGVILAFEESHRPIEG